MLVFVVEAPGTEGDFTDGHEIEDAIQAIDVGDSSDEEDNGNGAGVIEHELQGQDAPLDPVGGLFLDGGLGGDIDKVEGKARDEHEECDGDEQKGIGIPAVWL